MPTPDRDTALDRNYARPGLGETVRIRVDVTAPGMEVSIKIYNITGELLRRMEHVTYSAGWNDFEWDIRNEAGKTVGRGMYFIHIERDNRKEMLRVFIVK